MVNNKHRKSISAVDAVDIDMTSIKTPAGVSNNTDEFDCQNCVFKAFLPAKLSSPNTLPFEPDISRS